MNLFDVQGAAIDISHHGLGSQSVLVYATMLGCLIGWDLRAPGIAWKLENDLRKGKLHNQCEAQLESISGCICLH